MAFAGKYTAGSNYGSLTVERATDIDPEVSRAIGHPTTVRFERSPVAMAYNIHIAVDTPDGLVSILEVVPDKELLVASQGISRGFFHAIVKAWEDYSAKEERRKEELAAMEPSTPGCLPNDFWLE